MQISDKVKEQTIKLLKDAFARGVKPWDPPFLKRASRNHGFDSPAPYRGHNAVITELFRIAHDYKSRTWITFGKFLELQKSHPEMKMIKGSVAVSILRPVTRPLVDRLTGEEIVDEETGKVQMYTSFKPISVFNGDCFTGYEFKFDSIKEEEKNHMIVGDCESMEKEIISSYINAPKVFHDATENFYRITDDTVHLQPYEEYKSLDGFISTLAHELAHSTGAKHRLNRTFGGTMEKYSFEELIAEITASMFCVDMGILSTTENSASYLEGWASALENNADWFIRAFGYAEKAFERMTNGRQSVKVKECA